MAFRMGIGPERSVVAEMLRRCSKLLIFTLIGFALGGSRMAQAGACPTVKLCIAIDGSGSISSSNFTLMVNGLAAAIEDPAVLPQNGSVEISAVQFGSAVTTAVSPIQIFSQANANTVAAQLRAISKDNGGTNMSGAVSSCTTLLTGSCGGVSRQVINVVTDGEPTDPTATINARNAAISAGIDEINAEAVSAPAAAFNFLLNQLVYPQPGIVAPPFTSPGFVIQTGTFEDFADAVRGKIGQIVGQTCTIDPAEATNPLGTNHRFTVTVKNNDGTPAVGIEVSGMVTAGPHAGIGGGPLATDGNGQVSFNYDEENGAGTDTIEVFGELDGNEFSCTATKTWALPPPPCIVVPEIDTNPVNTSHTVTAIFMKGDGSPAADALVSISILQGPNATFLLDGSTNASGQITFTYDGGPNPGTDIIDFAGVVDEQIARCSAMKIWVSDPPICTVSPPSATNEVGERHDMTVTVLRGDGSPAIGVSITPQVISGPHAGALGGGVTNASGQFSVGYTGSSAGVDTIRFSGIADAQPFSCTASKTWEAEPPPCTVVPASDTNFVGEQHTMLVSFERGSGAPATGVHVSTSIVSGPNAPLQTNLVTNASGQISFAYTGGSNAGVDVIQFNASVDGHPVSCSGTKTWQLPPPPCTVVPASDTNFVGTQHSVQVTFRRGDGSLVPGVMVAAAVSSGPNSPVLADLVTDASGMATFSYTGGSSTGTDTITFDGFVDGRPVSCNASKTWKALPPPCTVVPASDTNPIESEHTLVVTFRSSDGSPASGVNVSLSIPSGPNAPLFADLVTNLSGQATYTYTGGATAGTDTIELNGTVEGQPVTCSATKTWEIPPPPCTVIPASDTNPVGTEHTMIVRFQNGDGSPVPAIGVSIFISSGPNSPLLSDATTDATGQVTFTYVGGENAGTDVIQFSGFVDDDLVSCSATKTWRTPPPPCTVIPATSTNPILSSHAVTAMFTNGDGSPASGVDVSISVTSGPNSLILADGVTNAAGHVGFTYDGGEVSGTDVIEFNGIVEGELVSCSATKTWVNDQPTCETAPTVAANLAGTDHTVTAIFRRADGSLVTGEQVSIAISAGPNAPLLADAVTDRLGRATLSYTGSLNAGTDVIDFSAVVDDQVVTCTAAKTWVVGQPSCAVTPSTDTNPVGSEHTVTATFRRGDGTPAGVVPVSIGIFSGPNAIFLADALSEANGQLVFTYTGEGGRGTDVIDFAGVVDGEVVTCSAIKTWRAAPPPCVVIPSNDTNPAGTSHTVTAYFRTSDGLRPWGLGVSVSIPSGPNGPLFADAVTGLDGAVSFTYDGRRAAGTDVIQFSAFLDGSPVTCSATKTWLVRPPSCTVAPAFDLNRTGDQHTATATFFRGNGARAAAAPVSISVSSGPNSLQLADAIADGNGQVSWTYTGGPNPGTDTIDFSGIVDGEVATCRAAKTWIGGQPTCALSPPNDVNPAGTRHTVTATFRRASGALAAGVPVNFGIFAGPNAVQYSSGFTNGSGQLAISYDGRLLPGTDIIELAAVVDGQLVRCAATKTWNLAPPPCTVIPSSDTNPVGTDHSVTAVFRRGNGLPAPAVPVSIAILAGPNSTLLADAFTGGDGRVTLTYPGGPVAGTDVIDFSAVVDGQAVACRARKTWIAGRPSCDTFPGLAANPVGTRHSVTAVFRRGDGSLAPGVNVSMGVSAGPNALVFEQAETSGQLINGVTNNAGQVTFGYDGGLVPGTDMINFSGFVDGQFTSCSATKRWIGAQPSCDVFPATAVNTVGTEHVASAVFRRGDGSPSRGAMVSIGISSGPNSPLFASAISDAGGQVALPYTGSQSTGTDTIDFSGFVDGQLVTCRATKTWTAGQSSCDTSPSVAANPAGTDHTVRAIFRRGDGSLAAGANVSITVSSGPNAPILANAITNARGEASFTYTGSSAAGLDVIDFSSFIDGRVARCSANKTWVVDQPTCSVDPATDLNQTGTNHTVTATFLRGDGSRVAGSNVTASVRGGPNAPQAANRTTDASGQASFTYSGAGGIGTDTIEFSGVVDGQTLRCRASKTWESAPGSCTVTPSSATNPLGSQHTATAVFSRGDGSPATGVGVTIDVPSGPSSPRTDSGVTNARGEVAFAYTGNSGEGTDVIDFTAIVDGRSVTCSANKTWVAAGPPSCDAAPSVAANPAGDPHTVKLIFRTTDGSLAAGVNVAVAISSGPNAPMQTNLVTDATGQAAFTYTGGQNAGVDVIDFSGVVEGQMVSCSATKNWVVGQPICSTAPNAVDKMIQTAHGVTATFLRGDGSPVAGVAVTAGISSGPNAPLVNNAVTDAQGQVQLSYTGGSSSGRDLIEFRGTVDGQVASCTASTNWVAGQPTCDVAPSIAANEVGTEHAVNAIFRRGDGSLASGVDVSIGVASGPNAPRLSSGVTGATGQLEFSYTGGPTEGLDVIEFSGVVDGQTVRCSASKNWVENLAATPTFTATTTPATSTPTATGTPPTSTPGTPATSTPTGTLPTSTPTPTGTLVPVCGPCAGDCNGDCRVAINELIVGVNIALAQALLEACVSFDVNGDDAVQINELVRAVRNALEGCPAAATATVGPPTATPERPTVTPGGGEDARSAAGGAIVATNAGAVIGSVVGGIITGVGAAGGLPAVLAAIEGGGAGNVDACPLGGSVTRIGDFPFVSITLSACKVAASVGAIVLDGTLSLQLTTFATDLDIDFEDAVGSVALMAQADLMGTLAASLGGSCALTAATLNISSGTLAVEKTSAQRASLDLDGTEIVVDNLGFGTMCIPESYRLTFDGPVSMGSSSGGPFDVTLDAFVVDVDASGNPAMYDLSGDADAPCYGGTTTTTTDTILSLPHGEICPRGGLLTVTLPRGAARIHHRADASVEIDNDADGSIDVTVADCLDAQLFSCSP